MPPLLPTRSYAYAFDFTVKGVRNVVLVFKFQKTLKTRSVCLHHKHIKNLVGGVKRHLDVVKLLWRGHKSEPHLRVSHMY